MGKLDKKVLKVINTREGMDFDVDDISIALKCDDDEVQESLDSLKDQGLIEAVIHNGKIFWKPARSDSFELADNPDMTQHPIKDDSSIDLLILEQPSRATVVQEQNKFQRTSEPQGTFRPVERVAHSGPQEQMTSPSMSTGRPMQRAFQNEMVDDNTRSFVPQIQPAKFKAPSTDDAFDDDEFDKPRRAGSSIGAIAVAVLLSAGVSALIAFSLADNATKGFNGTIAALEGKISESSVKLSQRIDALSAMVDNIKKDIAAQPPIAAPAQEEVKKPPAKPSPKQSVKSTRSTAAKKAASRRAAASKKKKTPSEMIQETSTSATSGESSSSSGESSSATPEATPSASSEPAGEVTNSPSASEPSSSSATESGSSSAPSEPSASGATGDGNPPASTDGSGQ